MAENFLGLESFYFWGQDRLGSLVPFLCLPWTQLGVPGVWAYGVVLWGLLWLGWECLAHCLQSPISRLLTAWILFFPYSTVAEFLLPGHPYAAQFVLLVGAWYLGLKAWAFKGFKASVSNAAAGLLAGLAMWVSEFSLVGLAAFMVYALLHLGLSREKREVLKKYLARWPFVLTFLPALAFIHYLKLLHTRRVAEYGDFLGSWEGFFLGIRTSAQALVQPYLNFRQDPGSVLALTAVAIFIAWTVREWVRKPSVFQSTSSAVFFSLNALGGVLGLWASAWVQKSGFESRYFAYPVIWGLLALVFWAEKLQIFGRFNFGFLLLVCVLAGSTLRTLEREFVLSRLDGRNFSLKELSQEPIPASGGIIGPYWYSYILALGRPKNLPVTAEESAERSEFMALATALQKEIWVCGAGWFHTYPRHLVQFNRILQCTGLQIRGRRLDFCKYRILSHEEATPFLLPIQDTVEISIPPGGTSQHLEWRVPPSFNSSGIFTSFIFFRNIEARPLVNIFFENPQAEKDPFTLPIFRLPNCQGEDCLSFIVLPYHPGPWRVRWENYSGQEVRIKVLKAGFALL